MIWGKFLKKEADGFIHPKGYEWLNDSSLVPFVCQPSHPYMETVHV